MECDAFICVSEFKSKSENYENQVQTSSDFYSEIISTEKIENLKGIVNFLIEKRPNLSRNLSLDFGAGQGGLALACSPYFSESWAIDFNEENLFKNISAHNLDNVKIASDIQSLPEEIDAVFCWHTIEHIPNASEVMKEVANKIAVGGVMLWQVPIYKPEYLANTHYTFFNEFSAERFCAEIGMKMCEYFVDQQNYFLTILAEK